MTLEPNLRARPNKPGYLQLAPVGHFNLLSVTIRKVIWDERGFVLLFCRVLGGVLVYHRSSCCLGPMETECHGKEYMTKDVYLQARKWKRERGGAWSHYIMLVMSERPPTRLHLFLKNKKSL